MESLILEILIPYIALFFSFNSRSSFPSCICFSSLLITERVRDLKPLLRITVDFIA